MSAGQTTEASGTTLTLKGRTTFIGTTSPISWTGTVSVSESDSDEWTAYTGTMAQEITAITSLTGSGLDFSNSTLAGQGAPTGDSGFSVGPVSGSAAAATDTISYGFSAPVPGGNSFLLWAPGALYNSYNGPFTYTFSASLDGQAVSTAGWTFSVLSPTNTSIPFTDTINPATGAITISNYTNGNFAVIVATPNTPIDHISVVANTIEEDAWGLAFSNTGATPAPTSLALAPSSDTGTQGDGITSDTSPVITGDGEAGDTVTLYANGTTDVLGQAVVSGGGTWSITTGPLTLGSYTLTAEETDPEGDASPQSSAFSLEIVAPGATVGFFNNSFASNDSSAYIASVEAAEENIISHWSAPVGYVINLQFDAEAQGTDGTLASNSWSDTIPVTYAQLTAALAAHDGRSLYAQDAVAALPANDPSPEGGADWGLPVAYARMLGLTTETPTIDDTVTLNTSYDWDYGQDVENTIEHEISEGGMGRIGSLGDEQTQWSTMDLFRYSADGAPDYTDGRDGATTYFSYDGGAETSAAANLSFNNEFDSFGDQVNGGDVADFTQEDVFGTGDPGETNTLSQTDMEMMDALGWQPVEPTVEVQNVSVGENASIAAASMITGLTNPGNDSIADYEFIDEGNDGGYFTVNGVAQPDNQRIEVPAANLGSIQYVGGPSAGSETLEIGVYDSTSGSFSGYSTLTATTTAPTANPLVDTSDFNGDGMSDVLWQNDNAQDSGTGQAAIWLMDGVTPTAEAVVGSPPPSWHVVGTGDFYGTGDADILWQNDDGQAAIWEMNGTTPTAETVIASPPPAWHMIATGDFNGDGLSDVLWQYEDTANPTDSQNGNVAIWEMNGASPIATAVVAQPGPDWDVIGTGDFNGDGKSDILWQYEDSQNASDPQNGNVAIWEMNGLTPTVTAVVAQPGPDWHVVATGDFNGDGDADILWQYEDSQNASDPQNGNVAIWLMDGTTPTAEAVVAQPGSAWHAIGTGDYDGSGRSDILWQNTNGEAAIWLMNGLTPTTESVFAAPPSSWHVIPS